MSTSSGMLQDLREKLEPYHAKINHLPLGILVIYFANAWVQTFPLIANTSWLLELNMAQDTVNNYYAFTFIPWSLKPIYAYIMDYLPLSGFRRKPWVPITACVAGGIYLINGYLVRSTRLAFGTVFIQQVAWAFNELLCGAVLMDYAHLDMTNAGNLQSVATAARAFGSLVAALLQLAVYPCHDSTKELSFQTVLLITGLVCIGCGMLFPFIPEPSESRRLQILEAHDNKRTRRDMVRVSLLVFLLEMVLVWISLKSFFDKNVFWPVLGVVTGLAISFAVLLGTNASIEVKDIVDTVVTYKSSILTAVFLFLLNSTPSAVDQLSFFQYDFFPKKCDLVHLSLINYGATMLASLCYGPLANKSKVRWILPAMGVVSGAVSMLTVPFVNTDLPTPTTSPCVHVVGRCFDPLGYRMVTTAMMGFVSQLALVPVEVIATEQTIPEQRLLMYSIFLSLMETGASVREWITAPIVTRLDITYTDWSNLSTLVWIGIGSSVFVSLLTPLFIGAPRAVEDEHSDEEGECDALVNKVKDEEE
eukprot:TRINITY_DN3880_c0_g1_i1.p1 TRINITY_DN3880_c0_g1~~TRINITY_DN3880_c0_g1_i1.p1  ORF type:complete len:533 (+),score=175.95 TRINITY_DN3880_c0_g1_i1:80-1678(+)